MHEAGNEDPRPRRRALKVDQRDLDILASLFRGYHQPAPVVTDLRQMQQLGPGRGRVQLAIGALGGAEVVKIDCVVARQRLIDRSPGRRREARVIETRSVLGPANL